MMRITIILSILFLSLFSLNAQDELGCFGCGMSTCAEIECNLYFQTESSEPMPAVGIYELAVGESITFIDSFAVDSPDVFMNIHLLVQDGLFETEADITSAGGSVTIPDGTDFISLSENLVVSYTISTKGCGAKTCVFAINNIPPPIEEVREILITKVPNKIEYEAPNDTIIWEICVENTGNQIENNVLVSDNIPSGTSQLSFSSMDGFIDNMDGSFSINMLSVGEEKCFEMSVGTGENTMVDLRNLAIAVTDSIKTGVGAESIIPEKPCTGCVAVFLGETKLNGTSNQTDNVDVFTNGAGNSYLSANLKHTITEVNFCGEVCDVDISVPPQPKRGLQGKWAVEAADLIAVELGIDFKFGTNPYGSERGYVLITDCECSGMDFTVASQNAGTTTYVLDKEGEYKTCEEDLLIGGVDINCGANEVCCGYQVLDHLDGNVVVTNGELNCDGEYYIEPVTCEGVESLGITSATLTNGTNNYDANIGSNGWAVFNFTGTNAVENTYNLILTQEGCPENSEKLSILCPSVEICNAAAGGEFVSLQTNACALFMPSKEAAGGLAGCSLITPQNIITGISVNGGAIIATTATVFDGINCIALLASLEAALQTALTTGGFTYATATVTEPSSSCNTGSLIFAPYFDVKGTDASMITLHSDLAGDTDFYFYGCAANREAFAESQGKFKGLTAAEIVTGIKLEKF